MNDGVISDAERLRRLQTITDAALTSLELDELLAALLERSRAILDADTCAVLLLDEEHDELVARAAVGLEEEVERGVRIPVGRGFAGRVAAERRPVILEDVDHADVLNPILREKGVKSLLGVPLLVRERVVGVLHVGTLTHRRFTEEEAELLRLAAERAAVGVEHARLYEAERVARRRVESVQAITDVALAHLEINQLLDVLLPRIRQILAADTCVILLLENGSQLAARAAVGLEGEVERGVRIPVGRGFAGRVAAERRPVIVEDVDRADVVSPILREAGIRSLLGVPMLAQGEVIGVLHVGSRTPRRFTPADVELLGLVAERVALALERGRLHEEIVRLDELKSNFVAIASHELRTPASSVYGVLATLAGRREELPHETRHALTRVGFEQAERLRSLIEQLLDLSQLDARRVSIDRKRLVLRTTLGKIVAATLPDQVNVRLDVAPGLAAVADPLVLDRIVSNLLINATRYGSPPIVVSAEGRERQLRIAVEDSGAGVPEDLQPQLFERFTRGDDARGSGLGLTIARAYARAHGGDLVLAEGSGGARFELLLPQG